MKKTDAGCSVFVQIWFQYCDIFVTVMCLFVMRMCFFIDNNFFVCSNDFFSTAAMPVKFYNELFIMIAQIWTNRRAYFIFMATCHHGSFGTVLINTNFIVIFWFVLIQSHWKENSAKYYPSEFLMNDMKSVRTCLTSIRDFCRNTFQSWIWIEFSSSVRKAGNGGREKNSNERYICVLWVNSEGFNYGCDKITLLVQHCLLFKVCSNVLYAHVITFITHASRNLCSHITHFFVLLICTPGSADFRWAIFFLLLISTMCILCK